MIDFDKKVLAPAVAAFARPIMVYPLVSQPGAAAYAARGIWSSKPMDVLEASDRIMSVQNNTLGVRLSEFAVAPVAGDRVDIPAAGSLPAVGLVEIDDTDDDGQGGSVWTVKLKNPNADAA